MFKLTFLLNIRYSSLTLDSEKPFVYCIQYQKAILSVSIPLLAVPVPAVAFHFTEVFHFPRFDAETET